MDERELTAFAVLSEELNFSRTARRLGLTQPAVSALIARLEADLGVRLFDRTKRRVQMTSAGTVFLEETERSLHQLSLSRRMARRAAEGKVGRVTVGFVEVAPFNVLPRLIERIAEDLPEVEIVLHEMVTADQIEALEAGRIDFGLMRPMFDTDRFEWSTVYREPFHVALSERHRLAGRGELHYAELLDEALITTPTRKRRYFESRFRRLVSQHGALRIVHEVSQIHAIIGLVAGGCGIAFVPRSACVIALPGIVYLPLVEPHAPTSELVAVWRRGEQAKAVIGLADLARRGFAAAAARV